MIHVSSEIGTLKKVLVHRPDDGIDRILPKRAEELLFDDIVHLPKMRKEHDIFTRVLKAFLGNENVYEVSDLLLEALEANEMKRRETLRLISIYEELSSRETELLQNLSSTELRDVLITGYYAKEDIYLFDPIPNFLFTRDIAVIVNDHVVITKAAKEARYRENFLTRFIFWAHPMFEEQRRLQKIINLNDLEKFPQSRRGEQVSVEGGDVMVLNKDYLLVGCSERTTAHGIQLLKNELFAKGVIKNVVQINISKARSWMHIDTVFTNINLKDFVAYKPLVIEGYFSSVQVYRNNSDEVTNYPSVADFLKAEIDPKTKFILSGNGNSPYDEREQWTDGCNLVAIKPGVALTYDRNPKTEEAFLANGYQILSAYDFLDGIENEILNPETIANTIITLPSSELSRARGGSHCMTCPFLREEI